MSIKWQRFGTAAAFLTFTTTMVLAAGFEPHETRTNVEDLVSAEVLKGTNYHINNPVKVTGVSNNYVIESRFGTFTASSDLKLCVRIREIDAIAALRTVDRA